MQFLILIAFFLPSLSAEQNGIIFTRNGEEIHGKILKLDTLSVSIKRLDNLETTFSWESLVSIKFIRTFGPEWKSKEEITDSILEPIIEKYLGKKLKINAGAYILYDEKDWILNEDTSFIFEHRRIVRINTEEGADNENSRFYYYFPDNSKIEILFARVISP
ncbi:MAG: DUF3857 domain-containing protein, partial [Fervidobacterium sp.]